MARNDKSHSRADAPGLRSSFYRSIVEQLPDTAVAIFDRRLTHLLVAGTLFDDRTPAPSSLEGKTLNQLLPADICARVEPLYRAALNGEVSTAEIPFEGRVFNVRWIPVEEPGGEVSHGLVIAQEVTAPNLRTGMDTMERKHSAEVVARDMEILEMIAAGEPLPRILTELARMVERGYADTLCSILLVDPDGAHLRHGAAPSLPPEYVDAIDGEPIGPNAGSCGTAAYTKDTVVVTDIATDPLWASYRDLALRFNLRACWSTPILSSSGRVLGTFALYWHEQRAPDAGLMNRVERLTHIAGIAIGHSQAQEKLVTLLKAVEESGEVIFMTDRAGKFTFVNPAFTQLYGYAEDEIVHTSTPRILKSGHMRTEEYERFWSHILGKNPHRGEMVNRTKDSRIVIVEVSVNPILGDADEVVGFLAIQRDITQRKLMEQQLQESRATYRELIENINEIIFSTDTEGTITYISPVVQAIGGYVPEEIIGRKFEEFILPEDRPVVRDAFLKVIAGSIMTYEFRALAKSGDVLWLESSTRPVRHGDTVTGISGVLADITKRRFLEQQLVQSRKLESLGTLAGGIAHDFNNILAIMLGNLSLVERYADDPTRRAKSIDDITKAITRGAGLVRQLLTFARKADITLKPVRVGELVEEVAALLRQTFPKIITVETKVESDLPPVTGDHTQIHQVLLNLCVNARDAMLPDGGRLLIGTRRLPEKAVDEKFIDPDTRVFVELYVSDTGRGMDEATRARVFEPFFTTKELGKGTGLGLSTVYGIVERHKGIVEVESMPGIGSTFRVYLPARTDAQTAEAAAAAAETDLPGGTETIFVVEDEEMLRDMVKSALESVGYTVMVAASGPEAVETFRARHGDIALVISDIGLPGLTGDKVFFALQKIDPKVRVILASGFIEPDLREQLLTAGVLDVVAKPFVPDELLQKVRAGLDGLPPGT